MTRYDEGLLDEICQELDIPRARLDAAIAQQENKEVTNGSKAIEATKCAAQGDGLFRRVEAIPAGFTPTKPDTSLAGKPAHAVLHSETGHHHAIDASDVIRYEGPDAGVCYLQLASDSATVTHLRAHDTHGSLKLLGGAGAIWEVRRQREWDGAAERRAQD